jgi:3-methyladenine DNA glycosylase Mpg
MPLETATDRRIGISAGKDLPWRFLAKNQPGVSVPAGKAR